MRDEKRSAVLVTYWGHTWYRRAVGRFQEETTCSLQTHSATAQHMSTSTASTPTFDALVEELEDAMGRRLDVPAETCRELYMFESKHHSSTLQRLAGSLQLAKCGSLSQHASMATQVLTVLLNALPLDEEDAKSARAWRAAEVCDPDEMVAASAIAAGLPVVADRS